MTDNNLFSSDPNKVQMPNVDSAQIDKGAESKMEQVKKAIYGDVVEKVLVDKEQTLCEKNYVFDFSDNPAVGYLQVVALKSLVPNSEESDTGVYLNKKSGAQLLGYGVSYELERLVPLIKRYVFEDEVKVYRDVKPGQHYDEVTEVDFTRLRLKL